MHLQASTTCRCHCSPLLTAQAVLDGRPVATGAFNPVTGLALLNINLQKPPGTYNIRLEVPGLIEKFHTSMSVTVVSCGPGEVRVQGEGLLLGSESALLVQA